MNFLQGDTLKLGRAEIFINGNLVSGGNFKSTPAGSLFLPKQTSPDVYIGLALTGLMGIMLDRPLSIILYVDGGSKTISLRSNSITGTFLAKVNFNEVGKLKN
jgi:hypothetical protein